MHRSITAALAVLAAVAAAPVAQAAITVPPGFRVDTFARGVPQPTAVAFDARGGMWVTSAGNLAAARNGVWYVPRPGARPRHVVRGLFLALGLTWRDGVLYVSHVTPFDDSAAAVPRRRGRIVAFRGWDGRRFRGTAAAESSKGVTWLT
jgi:hypothetical protein